MDTAWPALTSDILPTFSHCCVSASYFQISSRLTPRSATSVSLTYQWPYSYYLPPCRQCSAQLPLSAPWQPLVMLPPLSTGPPHRSQCWRDRYHWHLFLQPQGKSKSNMYLWEFWVWVLIWVIPEHCLWRKRRIHDLFFLFLTGLGPHPSPGRYISTLSCDCRCPPW